jgi:hypothetical protein
MLSSSSRARVLRTSPAPSLLLASPTHPPSPSTRPPPASTHTHKGRRLVGSARKKALPGRSESQGPTLISPPLMRVNYSHVCFPTFNCSFICRFPLPPQSRLLAGRGAPSLSLSLFLYLHFPRDLHAHYARVRDSSLTIKKCFVTRRESEIRPRLPQIQFIIELYSVRRCIELRLCGKTFLN